jgi:hypothetical protein
MGTKQLLVAFLALGFSLAFAVIPPDFSRSQISWEPAKGDEGGVFQLSRGWPESLTASTSCEQVRAGERGLILDTGGLKFLSTGYSIVAELEGLGERHEVILPLAECQLEMGFSSHQKTVYVSVNGLARSISVEQPFFPKVTRLQTPLSQPLVIQKVDILTRPTGIQAIGSRGIFALIATLLIVWSLFDFLRKSKPNPVKRMKSIRQVRALDWLVAIFVSGTAFLTPPAVDDGWVLASVDAFQGRGVFSNYYWVNDAFYPQGYMNQIAFLLLRAIGLEEIHLRLFVALIVIATWVVLTRGVIEPAAGRSNWVLVPAAGLYLSFAGSYLMTLRPEPFVSLCVAITFAALVKYKTSASSLSLAIGTVSCGIGVSLHQSGLVSILPWFATIFLAWKSNKAKSHARGNQMAALILGIAVSGLVVFLPFDILTVIDNLAEFSSWALHSNGLFGEASRYRKLLNVAGPFFFPVAAVILIIVLGAYKFHDMKLNQKGLWAVTLLSMAGLFLTGSKWVWHFGAYAVPGTILLALLISQLTKVHPSWSRSRIYSVLLPALLFLIGIVFEQFDTWGALAWHSHIWQVFQGLIRPSNIFIPWVIALVLSAILGHYLDKRLGENRIRLTAGFVVASLLIFPILTTMSILLLDATTSNKWTAARQNWFSFIGTDECGALSSSTFVESARPLAVLDSPAKFGTSLTRGGHPALEGLSRGPLAYLQTWGTWDNPSHATMVPDSESLKDHNFGKFVTPRFSVGDEDQLGVWSTTGGGGNQDSEIVFLGQDDELIGRVSLENSPYSAPFDRVWHLNKVQVPEMAVSTYLEVHDRSTVDGGWSALSGPSELVEMSAQELLAGRGAFSGPYEGTAYPCLELKSPLDGYWTEVEFVTLNASLWDARKYVGLTLTQIGCAAQNSACLFRVEYPEADVRVAVSK